MMLAHKIAFDPTNKQHTYFCAGLLRGAVRDNW